MPFILDDPNAPVYTGDDPIIRRRLGLSPPGGIAEPVNTNPSNFVDVLKSPGVWTGKDGVAGIENILTDPALQDKVQFGLMKSSYDELVKTGKIVTPATDKVAPIGQLYDAAANVGRNLISVADGLVAAPKALSSLSLGGIETSLSKLGSGLGDLAGSIQSGLGDLGSTLNGALSNVTNALSGGLGGISSLGSKVSGSIDSAVNLLNDPNAPPYTGDDPIIRARLGLPAVGQISEGAAMAANSGKADLGGLLANASKFGVDNAVAWAESSSVGLDAFGGPGDAISTGGIGNFVSGIQTVGASLGSGAADILQPTGLVNSALSGDFSDLKAKAGSLVDKLKPQMDSLAKQGQYAVNFNDFKIPTAVTGTLPAATFKGTVDRSTLNSAFGKLVGSAKIALPSFSPQAIDNSALEKAANQAKSILNGAIPGGLSGLSGSLDKGVNSLGDPNAPPYTGDDPIIRARLGLPPVNELDDGDFA